MIVHDLKSPLTVIMLLTRKELDEDVRDLLGRAYESGQSLLRMINTLLDIDRMEAGTLELKRERVDMAGLVREVVEAFEGPARWMWRFPEVEVDQDLIQRVLENLTPLPGDASP